MGGELPRPGLVVVGVHTPEFAFEQDIDNVRARPASYTIAYPVVLDNDYAIWRRFDNHYWPALYLADRDGIRFHHFGEGRYAETERAIQQLLGVERSPSTSTPAAAEAQPTGTR